MKASSINTFVLSPCQSLASLPKSWKSVGHEALSGPPGDVLANFLHLEEPVKSPPNLSAPGAFPKQILESLRCNNT